MSKVGNTWPSIEIGIIGAVGTVSTEWTLHESDLGVIAEGLQPGLQDPNVGDGLGQDLLSGMFAI